MTRFGAPATVARLRPFGGTIFAEMSELARVHGAVNLGQGYPDWDGPPRMLEIAREQILGGNNQYPPGRGILELRQAIADDRRSRGGLEYDPTDEVLVTVGATEAIAATILGLVEPGSEVILIEPYYDSYAAAVALAGARRVSVPLVRQPLPHEGAPGTNPQTGDITNDHLDETRTSDQSDGGPNASDHLGGRVRFTLDVDAVRAAITPATAMIVVNTPHNPTGTVLTRAELTALAEVAVEHDLLVLADEVYERLTFGPEHVPLATLPGMAERTVTVSSAAKTFNVTGWKIGWALGPRRLIDGILAAKQFLTFVGGGPFQPAIAHALRHEGAWVDDLRVALQTKRDRLASALSQAGLMPFASEGTYFVCADARSVGAEDALQFCRELPERRGVAAIPVSVFTDHPEPWASVVRFAFCKQDAVLDEGVHRLGSR